MDLLEDHERIAPGLNDAVVRRLFTAGLDLQAALGLMGDHPASGKICHAVDELDQAIRDIRDTIVAISSHAEADAPHERPARKAIPADTV